ncbi:uncharacterized protein SPSK_00633 [Sporothrix schenckii 1099-18]|uniref:Uncharacterized protein n=1 Tax=Sporothrix schenckii 1099-18 TaxID=1397361 RepID=A0A0F2LRH6_SPOSC|nr:uncharacterized protein SPSK_00633 [Sporothrix schenckii 1099-18]KJR80138.1 hypothetical protein SPSK_00633 [Sporothrix schenckii 1099-18]
MFTHKEKARLASKDEPRLGRRDPSHYASLTDKLQPTTSGKSKEGAKAKPTYGREKRERADRDMTNAGRRDLAGGKFRGQLTDAATFIAVVNASR